MMIKRLKAAMALLLTVVMLSGCASTATAPNSSSDEISQPVSATSSTVDNSDIEGASRQITDMAGRSLTVPAATEITKVYGSSPTGVILLYTLEPELLLGWNYPLNELESSYILPQYRELTAYGMGDSVNKEAIVAAAPELCIMSSDTMDAKAIDDADRLQLALGIPVAVVSGALQDSARVYRFLGELVGETERAEKLAVYADTVLSKVGDMDIPEDKKVTVYYGNGIDSLETAPTGTPSSQVIDLVGAKNVAELEMGEGNRINISPEQLLQWDPQIIVVNGEPKQNVTGNSAVESILANPSYATLSAVKSKQVFGSPKAPFSWIDRPTGANRLIGIVWLANLVYPEYYDYNIDEEVKQFYSLFYHTELTDTQLLALYRD